MSEIDTWRMIAEEVPTHDVGEVQIPAGGWISGWDALAWHEAGHAVVYTALGRRVEMVTIDPERARVLEPGRAPNVANGTCKTSLARSTDPLKIARQSASGSVAGVVAAISVRLGLGLVIPSPQEHLTGVDRANFLMTSAQIPEAGPDYESVCRVHAGELLWEHREAFGVIVRALLAHRTLEAGDFAACIAGTTLDGMSV